MWKLRCASTYNSSFSSFQLLSLKPLNLSAADRCEIGAVLRRIVVILLRLSDCRRQMLIEMIEEAIFFPIRQTGDKDDHSNSGGEAVEWEFASGEEMNGSVCIVSSSSSSSSSPSYASISSAAASTPLLSASLFKKRFAEIVRLIKAVDGAHENDERQNRCSQGEQGQFSLVGDIFVALLMQLCEKGEMDDKEGVHYEVHTTASLSTDDESTHAPSQKGAESDNSYGGVRLLFLLQFLSFMVESEGSQLLTDIIQVGPACVPANVHDGPCFFAFACCHLFSNLCMKWNVHAGTERHSSPTRSLAARNGAFCVGSAIAYALF